MHRRLTVIILIVTFLFSLAACSLPGLSFLTPQPPTATPLPYPTPLADVTVLPRDERPNIVFILVDDLDAKLGTIDYMPYLQELMIDEGLSLDDFLVTNSLCCPSRATFLRGQYTHCHQVFTNQRPEGGFQKFFNLGHESSTVGTWLQAAGYQTVFMGKYLNGYPFRFDRTYVPPGWAEWYSPVQGRPYAGLDYVLNENGELVAYAPYWDQYLTDVLSNKAVDYIHRAASEPAPFFMYLAPYAPHGPATPAHRHLETYLDVKVPRTPSFNEANVSDKVGGVKFNPLLTDEQIEQLDTQYMQRVQTMQSVDEMIKAIFDALQETDQLKDTYIIFTSDNGYHMGQHRLLSGKGRAFEEDIVVPFIIRGPGIPAAEVLLDYLAGNTDFAPTVADLAGVIPPDYVDGRSLVPLFSDDRPNLADWRQAYLFEFYGFNTDPEESSRVQLISYAPSDEGVLEPPDLDELRQDAPLAPAFKGLRTVQYLYLEYEDGGKELYDLIEDPYQLENIAASADPEFIQQMSQWLADLSTCEGASCTAIENRQHP